MFETDDLKIDKPINISGIDLGLSSLVTVFDGETIYKVNPIKPTRKYAKRLRLGMLLNFVGYKLDMEIHHIDGNHRNNKWENLQLLHRYCHDGVHITKSLIAEEPYEGNSHVLFCRPGRRATF